MSSYLILSKEPIFLEKRYFKIIFCRKPTSNRPVLINNGPYSLNNACLRVNNVLSFALRETLQQKLTEHCNVDCIIIVHTNEIQNNYIISHNTSNADSEIN